MPRLKPGTIFPTEEETLAIEAGIAADPDARELDDAWFATSRPAREVLPRLFGEKRAAQMLKPRGRPPLEAPKEQINIRLSQRVLSAFRATGKGWQTRIDQMLLEAVEAGRVQPATKASAQ